MATVSGKAIFITGAGHGIGAATAEELVRRGARVALVDTNADALNETAAKLGDAAWQATVDVTDEAALRNAIDAAGRWSEGLHAVVANAAVNHVTRLEDIRSSEFDRVVAVNLGGVLRTVIAALPQLRQTHGYLLLVCSNSGIVQGPYQPSYNASKAGLHALANTIRPELDAAGIGVGVAYLNAIATESAYEAMRHPLMASLGIEKLVKPRPVMEAAEALSKAIARHARTVYVPRQARLAAMQPALFQYATDWWVARRLRGAAQEANRRS